jgi:hypothetical protein
MKETKKADAPEAEATTREGRFNAAVDAVAAAAKKLTDAGMQSSSAWCVAERLWAATADQPK